MGIPASSVAKALRVLVIDDESLVRWSLGEALTACGHTVLTAADGRAALRLLADSARDSDVVVLDYRLPGDDGLTLLPRIQALVPTARVVLLTSYGSADIEARAHALGVHRVVNKPIDMDDVAGLVA